LRRLVFGFVLLGNITANAQPPEPEGPNAGAILKWCFIARPIAG